MSLYDRQLVLFSGKGGVGKTTVASGFAYSCARRGQRTLLMELNTRDKISSYFGSREIGTEITEVEENLHAVNVTHDAALEEYGTMILRLKLVYRAVFENRIVRRFLNAIPGLSDLLMIGKAYFHATEDEAPDGSPAWDMVVVDAPATGHGIFLMQIPKVIVETLGSGHMYEKAKEIHDFLCDDERVALNLVTLAEEMPVNETLMLRQQARDEIGLSIGCIVANGLYPKRFDRRERRWLERARDVDLSDDPGLDGMIEAADFRQQRIELQQAYVDKLNSSVDDPLYTLPYFFTERLTFPEIEAIADRFDEQMST